MPLSYFPCSTDPAQLYQLRVFEGEGLSLKLLSKSALLPTLQTCEKTGKGRWPL